MSERKRNNIKRIPLKAVGIEIPVKNRLEDYIDKKKRKYIKITESDFVSRAVTEKLDREENEDEA
jgi:ribosome maturation factor RimP